VACAARGDHTFSGIGQISLSMEELMHRIAHVTIRSATLASLVLTGG
jgi:hypothetical protein